MALTDLLNVLQQNAAAGEMRRVAASKALAGFGSPSATGGGMGPPAGGGTPSAPSNPSPVVGGSSTKGTEAMPATSGKPFWPATGERHQHGGYEWAKWAGDINVPGSGDLGNPVKAYRNGVVSSVQRLPDSYGNHIRIKHPNGTETLYAHLSKMRVKVGEQIRRGQLIGKVGSSGNSSGPHLHFEIKG